MRDAHSHPHWVQQIVLVLLRFAIGWHLFYQGIGKFRAVQWSARGYLEASWGPLAGLFHAIAESPWMLWAADQGTKWGLVIFGLCLMLGLFTRTAALGGTFLLLLFYVAAPPVAGFTVAGPQGTELYVDKTLLEALALLVVLSFPTGKMAGLDVVIAQWRARRDTYFGRRSY